MNLVHFSHFFIFKYYDNIFKQIMSIQELDFQLFNNTYNYGKGDNELLEDSLRGENTCSEVISSTIAVIDLININDTTTLAQYREVFEPRP